MKNKKILVAALVCAVFIVFFVTGALVLVPKLFNNTQALAAEAFTKARTVVKDFTSAELTMALDMDMVLKFSDQEQTVPIESVTTAAFDSAKGQIAMTVEMTSAGTTAAAYFVVDRDITYIKLGEEDVFQKFTLAELQESGYADLALGVDQFYSQQIWSQIDDDTVYTFEGEEIVNGARSFKYKVELKDGALAGQVDQQIDQLVASFQALGAEITKDDVLLTMGETVSYVWVKEDGTPVKEESTLDEVVLDIAGLATITISDMDMRMEFQSINQPVTIEVPKV